MHYLLKQNALPLPNWLSALLNSTGVMTGILTHTLCSWQHQWTRPLKLRVNKVPTKDYGRDSFKTNKIKCRKWHHFSISYNQLSHPRHFPFSPYPWYGPLLIILPLNSDVLQNHQSIVFHFPSIGRLSPSDKNVFIIIQFEFEKRNIYWSGSWTKSLRINVTLALPTELSSPLLAI